MRKLTNNKASPRPTHLGQTSHVCHHLASRLTKRVAQRLEDGTRSIVSSIEEHEVGLNLEGI